MANTKLPARLLDTSEVPNLNISGTGLGIGTTSTNALINLVEDNSRSSKTGTAQGQIHISGGTDLSNGDVSGITFSTNTLAQVSSIIGNTITNSGSSLFFGTSNSYSSGVTNTALLIDPSGNIGLGTAAPNCQLHVENSSDHVVARLKAGGTDKQASLRFQNDAQQWGVQCQTTDKFEIENLTVSNVPFQMNPDGYLVLNRNANEYGLQIRSAGTRSGLVIDKPGTSTIMGSALVIGADERFKLGTASYYHVEMKQNGDTKINNHLLLTDSFGLRAYSGYFSAGTSTGTFDFNTYGAGCYEVTAAFGHYGYINGYGCFKKAICSNGAGYSSTTSITTIDIATEITTTSGGSWSFGGFSSGSNTTSHIRVTKNAGNYGGGGYYFVEVRGNQGK